MKTKIIALRPMRYGTRRLLAGDEFEATKRDAMLLVRLKRASVWERPKGELPPIPEKLKIASVLSDRADELSLELSLLRERYQQKFSKRAYHGWDAATLMAKIDEVSE